MCEAVSQTTAVTWSHLESRAIAPNTPMCERYKSMPETLRGRRGRRREEWKLRPFVDFAMVPAQLIRRELCSFLSPRGEIDRYVYYMSTEGEAKRIELLTAASKGSAASHPAVMLPIPWHLGRTVYRPLSATQAGGEEDEEEADECRCEFCGLDVEDEADAVCLGFCCKLGLHVACAHAAGYALPLPGEWFCGRCRQDEAQQYLVHSILSDELRECPKTNQMVHHYLVRWKPGTKNQHRDGLHPKGWEETWEPLTNLGKDHPKVISYHSACAGQSDGAAVAPAQSSVLQLALSPPSQLADADRPLADADTTHSTAGVDASSSPAVECVVVATPPASVDKDPLCGACNGRHRPHTCSKARSRKLLPAGKRHLDELSSSEVG